MNPNMLIQSGDELIVGTRRADDGTNDGSIIVERRPGHVYCIAKAPRFASAEEWRYNASLIVSALSESEKIKAENELLKATLRDVCMSADEFRRCNTMGNNSTLMESLEAAKAALKS